MILQDIQCKIKEIQIHTRRLISGTLIGDTRSAQKVSGLDFDQIREYQQGDDVSFIDWKSSARTNKLLVKQYTEERSRTIILAVDVSASSSFSSTDQLKSDIMSQVSSILALVAYYGSDRVALLLFSDVVELFIPPGKSKYHVHAIMQKLFFFKPRGKKTDIGIALDYIARLKKKDSVVFLVSDFVSPDFSKQLSVVAKKYEIVAVRCLDNNEYALPQVGLLTVQDPETNQCYTISCSDELNVFLRKRMVDQNNIFRKYGVDCIEVIPKKQFIGDLIRFFRKRMRY